MPVQPPLRPDVNANVVINDEMVNTADADWSILRITF